MGKKYFLIAISFFLLTAFSTGEYRLMNSIAFDHAKFTTDNLGNAFVIMENQLLEFDSIGKPK